MKRLAGLQRGDQLACRRTPARMQGFLRQLRDAAAVASGIERIAEGRAAKGWIKPP